MNFNIKVFCIKSNKETFNYGVTEGKWYDCYDYSLSTRQGYFILDDGLESRWYPEKLFKTESEFIIDNREEKLNELGI